MLGPLPDLPIPRPGPARPACPSLLEPAMPNTPSAIKRLKQNAKRRIHNRITKKIIKTYMPYHR